MIHKLLPVSNYIIDSKFLPPALTGLGRIPVIIANQIASAVNLKYNPYEGRPELIQKYAKDAPIGMSILGTPIYTDLSLLGCQYTDNITNEIVTLANERFRAGGTNASAFYMNLESIICTINQVQRIIKTEIQGRNGTIKEYIGADDMQITINGVITGKNGVHPKEEVIRLKKWLDAPVAKGITSWWTNNLGLNNIVVENYSFPQTPGGYSYQQFTINAISDMPVELRIQGQ